MKNMSSSLSKRSFIRDYTKSQQIKNRLMRYVVDKDSKVSLKSERYFSNEFVQSRISQEEAEDKAKIKVKHLIKYRKSAINHYKKEQILKNKVNV